MGIDGGRFSIGGYEETLQANENEVIEWFPLLKGESHYKIGLDAIQVGTKYIPNPPIRGFIDCGTTFAYTTRAQKQ